jgi:hypothetical protein
MTTTVKQQQHLMGRDPEPKVQVDARTWTGTKLALWRSKVAWDIVARQAAEILGRCKHMTGCPAESVETEGCLPDCPDREFRMSALVILNAARQSAPVSASKLAQQPYMPPSREFFSDVVAELAACQAELEAFRAAATLPPPPPQDPQLEENPS